MLQLLIVFQLVTAVMLKVQSLFGSSVRAGVGEDLRSDDFIFDGWQWGQSVQRKWRKVDKREG